MRMIAVNLVNAPEGLIDAHQIQVIDRFVHKPVLGCEDERPNLKIKYPDSSLLTFVGGHEEHVAHSPEEMLYMLGQKIPVNLHGGHFSNLAKDLAKDQQAKEIKRVSSECDREFAKFDDQVKGV